MPWVNVGSGTAGRGETFYLTTIAAPSKSYILERTTTPNGDNNYWGVWRLGYFVQLVTGQPLRWVERSSVDLYAQRQNYFVQATGDIQAFAFYLPRRSPYRTVSFILYRFD